MSWVCIHIKKKQSIKNSSKKISDSIKNSTSIFKALRPKLEHRFWIGFIFDEEYWRTPSGEYLPFAHSHLPNRRKLDSPGSSCAQLNVKSNGASLESVSPCDSKRNFVCEIFPSYVTSRGPRPDFSIQAARKAFVANFEGLSYFQRIKVPQTTWKASFVIQSELKVKIKSSRKKYVPGRL